MPAQLSSLIARLDRFQQRLAPLAVIVAVARKFDQDRVSRLGVQVAYWGFFSLFALLLAFTSILGFVFQGNPSLQHQLVNSTLERMPVIGPEIRGSIGTLTGSGVALAVGIAGALWTGLGVTHALAEALDELWGVPRVRRGGFVRSRLRGLLVLITVGTVNVLATVAVGIVAAGSAGTTLASAAGLAASGAVDLVLFTVSFKLLTSARPTTAQILPGAALAAALWLGLQALGGVYVTEVLSGSSQVYGTFAAVVGLLTWLLLASQMVLVAAELNAVLAHRLWPRSLTGPLLEGDRRALVEAAQVAQLHERERIAVSFDPPSDAGDA